MNEFALPAPEFPEAQLALGECLVETGSRDAAVAALNEGLKWGPKWRPRFLVALGILHLMMPRLAPAPVE